MAQLTDVAQLTTTRRMKRNIHLQPLSRQHHNGLLAALLVNKGLKKGAGEKPIADFITHIWQQDLQSHFAQEEELLIPALQTTAFDTALTRQLLQEHQQIRSLVNRIGTGNFTKDELAEFAHILEQHIRFEERIYFPEAEKALTEDALQQVGHLLNEQEGENCMNYPVKFWE